jgi:hypothetical protein
LLWQLDNSSVSRVCTFNIGDLLLYLVALLDLDALGFSLELFAEDIELMRLLQWYTRKPLAIRSDNYRVLGSHKLSLDGYRRILSSRMLVRELFGLLTELDGGFGQLLADKVRGPLWSGTCCAITFQGHFFFLSLWVWREYAMVW